MKLMFILFLVLIGWIVMGVFTYHLSRWIKKPIDTIEAMFFWVVILMFIGSYYSLRGFVHVARLCGMETDSLDKMADNMYGSGD